MDPIDPDPNEQNDLTERLADAVDGVAAAPDLGAVLVGAGRFRRRRRLLGVGAAAAVVALGVGGVVLVADRDTGELPAAQPDPVVVPLTTMPPSDAGADETADTTPTDAAPTTTYAVDDPETPVEIDSYLGGSTGHYDPNLPDPAEPYLGKTTEIYRRATPSGNDIQIRLSDVSYGALFDIEWDLPTGSAEECLGGPAAFIGSPDGPPQWLSTWTVQQWRPLDPAQEILISEHYTENASNLILRTSLDAVDAVLMQGTTMQDRAEFANGVAIVEMLPFMNDEFQNGQTGPLLTVTIDHGGGDIEPLTVPVYGDYYDNDYGYGGGSSGSDCSPPPFPGQELPEPGAEHPADVVAAEAAVRERHALLVDQTDIDKLDDLLTDDTGVAEAREQMEAGPYAESAAGAVYTIDGVVFTDADTAWFEYTIDAPTGTFGPRFGQAIHNGQVWQITRDTICQDLALANGYCDPDQSSQSVTPPLADGVDYEQAVAEWEVLSNTYSQRLYCNPLNPCGDFDLSGQLPEPGEQPADPESDRREVTDLMESMYGAGALLDRIDRIDDPTGVAEAVEQFGGGMIGDEVASAVALVDEVVFTAPDVAAFRYTIETQSYDFPQRVGSARRIDGVWKITRATVCSDFALGGGQCSTE